MTADRKDRAGTSQSKGGQRLLLGLVLASSLASVLALVWWQWRGDSSAPRRVVDPDHLRGDDADMAEVAESFVTFWSTFRYEEAANVSTGDSLDRVQLAMEKEQTLSPAERELAQDLRKTVEGLEVEVRPSEVVEEGRNRKILRAVAIVKAADRTVRREQEFVMVREGRQWKVSAWDPGEPAGAPEGAAEPGLQLLDPDRDGGEPVGSP